MSEYQYHEWQTVDRILTREEQAAVNRLSSHIEVSPSRAMVTYNWSDFGHDPKQVLLKYFDAYFYLANWGSLRLMFRFPKGLLEEADIEPYCVDEYVSFETSGMYQVLDLDFSPEDGGEWMEADADLSEFVHLRADLLEGDYRLLYLAWLRAVTIYGVSYEDDYVAEIDSADDPDDPIYDHEPPVPPGMKKLSPALQSFVQVFEIDPFLVQAAAEASPDPKKALAMDYRDLVSGLSRSECNDFLTLLAEGDPSTRLSLRKRLGEMLPKERHQPANPRTIQLLLKRAGELKKAEAKHQAETARRKHIAEMEALSTREEQTWQQVDNLLENGRKIASVYDEATALLDKLEKLAEFQDTQPAFQARLRHFIQKYASRPSLIERWKKRNWVSSR
ncbi:MAG: hypothetical protein ACM3PY_06395 [Omnitrophica WOR_2 bacterium]